MKRVTLRGVSTGTLEALRQAVADEHVPVPITREGLTALGIRHNLEQLVDALGGHRSAACIAILGVAIAERADTPPRPSLVWSGPDSTGSGARDTAVVLREMFEGARSQVILAGYSFTRGSAILEPLHRGMLANGLEVSFFINVTQAREDTIWETHITREWSEFVREAWPFGPPYPRAYYDVRAEKPGGFRRNAGEEQSGYASFHAKCVVVDGQRAFISSANFTERAQERNIECGVLIDDPHFAELVGGQWIRLIEAGLVRRFDR
jgi:hypothetical protein